MSKDNRVFLKKVRVIFICCLKTYKYWRSQKIIYQHIYFDRLVHFHPSMRFRVIFFYFSLTVKAAPHECVIRTGQL